MASIAAERSVGRRMPLADRERLLGPSVSPSSSAAGSSQS